jgi:hypothetical protein
MSKNTLYFSALFLLIIITGGIYFMRSPSVQKELLLNKEEKVILLYKENGDVSFKIPNANNFEKLATPSTVIPNLTIVHTDTGNASVLLPDNSLISLDKNTEITINYTESKTSIYQSFGKTYHRVEKLLSGDTYQVQTPGTLAAVRGTKFAVNYNEKTKKTKVAVTENSVQVSSIPKTVGTTTPPAGETVVIEEGKTVSVVTVEKITVEMPSVMNIVDTKNDVEMNAYVEEEKKVDIKLEEIKKTSTDTEEFRKEMKRELFNDVSEDEFVRPEEENVPETQTEDKTDTQTDKQDDANVKEETKLEEKPDTKIETPVKEDIKKTPETQETTTAIRKMTEEEYFDLFNDMFIKYFYIDEGDSTCLLKVPPEERVRLVTSFAKNNGYPFTSGSGDTLFAFAKDINGYCMQKDSQVKIKLQTRFDDEFPYKENI